MLRSKLSSLREYLTPINHSSNFSTTGEISPEEFVQAGDYLVYKFPTWQWSSCAKPLQKSFLPEDKQFLITKHVPSYQRASDYLSGDVDGNGGFNFDEDAGDEWVTSNIPIVSKVVEPEVIEEIIDDDEDDELRDSFDDLEMINNSDNKLRKYDLYITYSTSYRVPKLYLVGFNSNGIPLLPNQMFEDINADYKDKTATIETLPVAHNTTSVSIHPCKHSSVMKVLMQHSKRRRNKTTENEPKTEEVEQEFENLTMEDDGIRVDQYLVIFLKFIASVTPGIEYDYTMDAL